MDSSYLTEQWGNVADEARDVILKDITRCSTEAARELEAIRRVLPGELGGDIGGPVVQKYRSKGRRRRPDSKVIG